MITDLQQHFQQMMQANRLHHLYLLTDATDEQRLAFAQWLAVQVVNPSAHDRIVAGDHPDVLFVGPIAPSQVLKVDQIRALRPEFTTSALESETKVIVIQAAETMTASAANSLLKFIEEPAGPQLILLLAEGAKDILPTIRSRAQIVSLHNGSIAGQKPQDEQLDADWVRDMQMRLLQWLDLMARQQIQAFAYVQKHLISANLTPVQEAAILRWWQQIWRDVVVMPYVPADKLKQPNGADTYRQLHQRFDMAALSRASQMILDDDQLRQVNISLQARLEKMVLDISQVLV